MVEDSFYNLLNPSAIDSLIILKRRKNKHPYTRLFVLFGTFIHFISFVEHTTDHSVGGITAGYFKRILAGFYPGSVPIGTLPDECRSLQG